MKESTAVGYMFGMVAFILLLMVFGSSRAQSGPLDDLDQLLKGARQPAGTYASVAAMAVAVQTDLLGSDDPKIPPSVRNYTGKISPIQHKRDDLKTLSRQMDVLKRQLGFF